MIDNYYRRQFFFKHTEYGKQHFIKILKKFTKKYLNILSKEDLDYAYSTKGKALLEFKRFDEANDCFDKIIKMQGTSIKEAYFYKGFIKSYFKDYESAIQYYKNGVNQIDFKKLDICEDARYDVFINDNLLHELLIAHIQLYGKEKGLYKMLDYVNKFIDPSLMFHNELLLRYRAQINYYLDVEKSLQDYELLYSNYLEKFKDSKIHSVKTDDTYNIIKCNLKIWKTTGINKFNEVNLNINKMPNHIYFIMNLNMYEKREILKDLCLSYLAYKLDNKIEIAKQFRDIIKQFCREIRLVKACEKYPLTKLKKYLSIEKNTKIPIDFYNKFFKEHFDLYSKLFKEYCGITNIEECTQKHLEKTYKEVISNLARNNSVNLEFFSYIYNKLNVNFEQQEIADVIIDGTPNVFKTYPMYYKNYISKLKFLLEKNIPDLNTFMADGKKIISYCISWWLPLEFIKYLVEEKKVNYKEDKDIFESIVIVDNYDMFKYFKEFQLPKDDKLLFTVCEYANITNTKILKYLLEELKYNPQVKNECGENLLFGLVNSLGRYKYNKKDKEEKEKKNRIFSTIDYLVNNYNLDVNEFNIYNQTILYLSLKNADYETTDYLLKKHKVKIDKYSQELLSKDVKKFLNYIYKGEENGYK